MPSKRKHITLTIKQKSDILERLVRGESGKVLANEYGVGTSTISDIKKKQGKIKRYVYMIYFKDNFGHSLWTCNFF